MGNMESHVKLQLPGEIYTDRYYGCFLIIVRYR
jgi:hypothetical protein